MPDNPFAQYKKPNPFAVYKTQGTGPKAPAGFGKPGDVQPLVAIPGGPDSPEHAAAVERARSMAGVPATIAEAKARAAIELSTERAKQNMLSGAATLPPQLDRLVGDDFLKALPPATASTVKALVDGRMAFPAGAAMRSPYWQQMLANVAHADPNFDAVNYNARSKTRVDFTSGQSARNIRSLNTAIGHLGHLSEQLGGTASHGGFPLATTVNQLQNAFMRGEGKSGPTLFDQTSGALASELTQVFRGSGGAEADVKRYLSELSPNASMEQKQAAIKNIAGLLQSRLEAVGDQYRQGMGKTIDPIQLLNPHAQKSFSAILGPDATGGGDGGPPPTSGGPHGGGGVDPNNPYGPAHQQGDPMALATGKTREVPDQQANAVLDSLLRSGANDAQINAAMKAINHQPVDPKQTAAARAYMAKHPDYQGGFGGATKTEEQGWLNRAAAHPVGTFAGAAIDGGLGGLTDEATGLIDKVVHGGDWSELTADANARKQLAYGTHSTASTLGNIVGTGATAVGGGMLLKGVPLVGALGRTAPYVGGGLYGGVSGAGQNNDDRIFGAGMGTVAGLAGTGIGQGLAFPVGALARTAPVRGAINGGRRMFGAGSIQPEAALNPAEGALFKATTKAGPDNVRGFLDQASNLGVPASLADTTPEIRELAASAVRRSPTAAQTAESAFLPRARGQNDRFAAAVSRDLGPVGNVPQLSAQLTNDAEMAAAPLFDRVRASPPVSSPDIESLLNTPFGNEAIAKARTIAANRRMDPKDMGFAVDRRGNVVLNPVSTDLHGDYAAARSAFDDANNALSAAQGKYAGGGAGGDIDGLKAAVQKASDRLEAAQGALDGRPTAGVAATMPGYTWRTLLLAKQGMDDVLEQHRNPLTGKLDLTPLGQSQNEVKNKFLSTLDNLNDDYAPARQAFAGPSASRDALARGQDAFSLRPDDLAMQVGNQSPEHLAQMQLGFRSDLIKRANDVRDASNPFEATLGAPNMRARVDILHPNNPGTANLFATRDMEGQIARSTNDILGNSKSAQRLIADQDFTGPNMGDMAAAGIDVAHGGVPVGTMANGLKKAGMFAAKRRAVAKADQLAPMVFNTDPKAASAAIDDLIARAMARNQYVQRMRPTNVMGMLGGGFGASTAQGY